MPSTREDTRAGADHQPWPDVEYARDTDGELTRVRLGHAAALPVENFAPVRKIRFHRNQTHTPGWYWSSTTQHLIPYESNLERNWLTILDFDPYVTAISSQPLRLHGPVDDDWLDHVPDFFVRLRDGTGRLIDVSHPVRADSDRTAAQVALTRRCADHADWEYEQLRQLSAQRWTNISWLAGYRRPLPIAEGLQERLLALALKPVALQRLVAFADEPLLALPAVFHLCWQQRLTFDLDCPLSDQTLLVATERT